MVKKADLLPEGLKAFYNEFEANLSKPQFNNLKSWTSGIIEGKSSVYKIKEEFSEKHVTSLTRFMNESPWNHKELNNHRIKWATNILTIRHQKYYPIIIDDTVNRKYGSLIFGTGKYYSNSEKRVINGQSIVTSHLYVSGSDIPLFVDLYQKKENYEDPADFKSKIDFAMQHIRKAPHLKSRCGVIIADSWYGSLKVIKTTIKENFEGIFALKKNRKVKFQGIVKPVSAIPMSKETNFDLVTVEGKEYQVWTSKVNMAGITDDKTGKAKRLRLLISQQKLENKKWSDYTYLLATDLAMDKWTILHLYRKRWKIETFYKFAKNAFDFKGSQMRTYQGGMRYFILLFFAYTYLTLTRFPHFLFEKKAKSHYEAQDLMEKETIENLVTWIYKETINGVDLDEIKLKLGC